MSSAKYSSKCGSGNFHFVFAFNLNAVYFIKLLLAISCIPPFVAELFWNGDEVFDIQQTNNAFLMKQQKPLHYN